MYQYKEFPRTLHKPDGRTLTVGNEDEREAALVEGWSLVPLVDLTGNRFDLPEVPATGDVLEVSDAEPVVVKKGRRK